MIKFFFEKNNKVITLPVNPPEIVIMSKGGNKTTEIVKLGEINILKKIKLSEFAIECFFPAYDNGAAYITDFKPPEHYIDFFNNLRVNEEYCNFSISGVNGAAFKISIEQFDFGLKAGDDDIHYSMKCKEYKPYSAKAIKITAG